MVAVGWLCICATAPWLPERIRMTREAGIMLVSQIMPSITRAIARGVVTPVPPEDREELTQDCVARAARLLDAAERNGKTVTPGNIVYYTLKGAIGGRRALSAHSREALGAIARSSRSVIVMSLDAPVSEVDGEEGLTLHEMLAAAGEGPDVTAARNLDWDEMTASLSDSKAFVVHQVAGEVPGKDIARQLGCSQARVVQVKRETAEVIRAEWGDGCLVDTQSPPAWQRHVQVARERRSCRYERAAAAKAGAGARR